MKKYSQQLLKLHYDASQLKEKILMQNETNNSFTGDAFVSFETELMKIHFLEYWTPILMEKIFPFQNPK